MDHWWITGAENAASLSTLILLWDSSFVGVLDKLAALTGD